MQLINNVEYSEIISVNVNVFTYITPDNPWSGLWPFCLFILRLWLVREQFELLVFPPGELCANWIRAVITWVNDIECQCFLNEHMVQPVIYQEICVES